jgi:hypothetical protein
MTESVAQPLPEALVCFAPPPNDSTDALSKWAPAPAPVAAPPTPTPEAEGARPREERSENLARLLEDSTPRGTALRAGAGLLATLPFALAAGHASRSRLAEVVGGMLSIPLALAIIAVVGLAASTIGISLLSQPLSPARAASVGAHGLLRTGLVLLGFSPITALWVASYDGIEVLIAPTLAWGLAGILGLGAMNGRLHTAVHPHGTPSLGTLVVIALLTVFTVVLGVRMWIDIAPSFQAANFGEVAS